MPQNKAIYYGNYLELPSLLSAQKPVSKNYGTEAHDETLFIIVHQVYELWFKQMIHDVNSVLTIFNQDVVAESQLLLINTRIERILKIQSVLDQQIDILETMTPMDFLEFRDYLYPASGFQSVQFRELEIKLGLSTRNRHKVDREFFLGRLSTDDREKIESFESLTPLKSHIEQWLERLPFSEMKGFSFWSEYKKAVSSMLKKDEKLIKENDHLSDKEKKFQIMNYNATVVTFESLLNKEEHEKLISAGSRTFSHKATLNALFILLYRDLPILHGPSKILLNLLDMDENFTHWRYRHAMMAHRMLGTKIGTGGSSGYEYLKKAAENNRVFLDLFDLSTFLVPKSILPVLPKDLILEMNKSLMR
ncbi:tryptophan 2,3-dioxygenase [bacterium]|nr:tryptophan 2,3-dioxygenase [bacterium]